jgi:hypothetical protein
VGDKVMTEIELLKREYKISDGRYMIFMTLDAGYSMTFSNIHHSEDFNFINSKMEVIEPVLRLMMEAILFVKDLKSKEELKKVLS